MTLPSEVDSHQGLFDRFASKAAEFVSRAPFFTCCILLVVVWAPSLLVVKSLDTWQLLINTPTTVITFLLVAIAANDQARFEGATNKKLNAVADALADLIEETAAEDDSAARCKRLHRHAEELRQAVGLEHRESA